MGERKGTNHYYPPDYDPSKGGLNKFLGTHALRERARKLHLGILIIRFEMPYNIWCDGCGNHIGMGVRYNAEKTKVGMYYSTPLYQFRMKCHLCDNHFEIKTDPGNLDYVIVSGARRQENRWDPTQNGQIVPDDKEVQKRLFDDAMFKLEHGERDRDVAKAVGPALGRLAAMREDRWRDDYAANCALRAKFRTKRRELKAKDEKDRALLARSSLDIQLLPETDEDRKMAALLSLAPSKSVNERKNQTREEIINRPALPSCSGNSTTFMGVRAAKQLEKNITKNCLGILTKSRTISKSKKWRFPVEAFIGNGEADNCTESFDGEVVDNGSEKTPNGSSSSSSVICSPENSSTSQETCEGTPENSSTSQETCVKTPENSSTSQEMCAKTPEDNNSTSQETCAKTPENNSSTFQDPCVKTTEHSSASPDTCAKTPDNLVSMDVEGETDPPVPGSNNVSLVSGDYDFSSSDESV